MRKLIRNISTDLSRFETRRNWRILGILYLTVLVPLIIAAVLVMNSTP